MEILMRMWLQIALTVAAMLIGTAEFLGFPTTPLWTDILPEVRFWLGLG